MEQKDSVHLRRCHMCGTVNQRMGAIVLRCTQCGKAMAPYYYYDDFKVSVYSECDIRPADPEETPRPVRGLSAAWD